MGPTLPSDVETFGAEREAPQLPQKRADGSVSAPQLAHLVASAVPHSVQNRTPGGARVPQDGHSLPEASPETLTKVTDRNVRVR
jgi:hypothetical protein